MALICPQCGAENRDAAKFCLKCAHQLVPLPPPPAPAARSRRRRRVRLAAPVMEAEEVAPKRVSALVLAVLTVFAIGALWGIAHIAGRAPAPLAEAPATHAAAMKAEPPALPTPPAPATPEPAQVLFEPASAPALASEPEVVSDTRPEPPPARPAPVRKTPRTEPPVEPVTRPTPPAPAVVESPVAAAPAQPPATLCAGTRFVAHALCLQRECDKPGRQQHPQCVRMREQQKALQQGSGDG